MKNSTLIIAEAGVNHNGDLNTAFKLIDVAREAGADYVKFQTFSVDTGMSKNAKKAEYQKVTTASEESQYEMAKKLELSKEDHFKLIAYCKKVGIRFLSSPFDIPSIDLLNELEINIFKIPSGEITNYPYLKKIALQNKPVIMSTGMSNIADIDNALQVLCMHELSREHITLLHCNTEYPTPMKDVNLKAMQTIAAEFPGVKVGYSDHTLGVEVPIAAVAMGAVVIEKHFTLDRNLTGPDHRASLEPEELKEMVKVIRNIELALGNGIKDASPSESKNRPIARKSIIARCGIKKGEIFTEDNLSVKRPGTGISPMRWENIIGEIAQKDFQKDDLISI